MSKKHRYHWTRPPANGHAPLKPPAALPLTEAQKQRLAEANGGMIRLKLLLAERWLALREVEDAYRVAQVDLVKLAHEIMRAHGIDPEDRSVRWHLDADAQTITRVD